MSGDHGVYLDEAADFIEADWAAGRAEVTRLPAEAFDALASLPAEPNEAMRRAMTNARQAIYREAGW